MQEQAGGRRLDTLAAPKKVHTSIATQPHYFHRISYGLCASFLGFIALAEGLWMKAMLQCKYARKRPVM